MQISDIHWKEGFASTYGERFSKVGDALPAHFVDPIDCVVFAYGGDFAYSGREEEYEEIYGFLREAESSIRGVFGADVEHYAVGVPGNHDCDFSGDQSAREALLGNASGELKFKGAFTDVLLQPQVAFEDFISVVTAETPEKEELMTNVDTRIAWRHLISVKGEKLSVLCYNSAWLSRLREKKGHLALPVGHLKGLPKANFQVSIVHHPVAWLETVNALDLRKLIYESSDMVLTGHEHSGNTLRGELEGAGNAALHEATAFIPETASENAGFTAIYVDTEARKESKLTFLWHDDRFYPYAGTTRLDPDQSVLQLDLTINRYRRNRDWEFSDVFSAFLRNPELELRREGLERITLPDIFVCPDVRELSVESNYEKGKTVPGDVVISEISSRSASFVCGADQSGKTALAKMTALHLKQEGHLPVLAKGYDLPQKADLYKPYIARLVREQYGDQGVEDFLSTPLIEKVLIVDDYQHAHPNLRKDHVIFDIAARFFGRTVVFCHDAEISPFDHGKLALKTGARRRVLPRNP